MTQLHINLLPGAAGTSQQHRGKSRKTASGETQAATKKVAVIAGGGIVGAALLLTALLLWLVGSTQQQLNQLQATWSRLKPQRLVIEAMVVERQELERQVRALERVVKDRIAWSAYLNRLSDILPEGVWLVRLRIDATGELRIEGTALELQTGNGMKAVSQLHVALQRDPVFTSVFDKITLQSFNRRTVGPTDVLDFRLQCEQKRAMTEPAT